MASPELTHLLHVLSDRGIELGHDDIAWAFESPKTRLGIASWVNECLSPATLLTPEEAAYHARNAEVRSDGVSTGAFVSEGDLEAAIASLEASTAAIERQCRLLEAQKQALRNIQARNNSTNHSGVDIRAQQSSKSNREKAQLEFEINDLVDSLQSQLDRSLKHAESATNSIQPCIERVLEKDDRLLDGLEKALQHIATPASGSGNATDEVERLCQALTTFASAEIHTRIDAAYCSSSSGHGHEKYVNGSNGPDVSGQGDALRAELDELCREIDGLSAMAVDNQYRAPISKALAAAKSDSDSEKAIWAEYLSATLHFLTGRLEAMNDGSQHLRTHFNALKSVSDTLEAVLAMPVDDKKQHGQVNGRMTEKMKMEQKGRGLKPLRLVQANMAEGKDPTTQLLRALGVKPSVDAKDAPEQLAEHIEKAIMEKTSSLSSLTGSSKQSMSDQIVRSLVKADADVQSLLSAVSQYSPFGAVSLENQELESDIGKLEWETQGLGDEMRQLDVDGISRGVRTKQQEFLRQSA